MYKGTLEKSWFLLGLTVEGNDLQCPEEREEDNVKKKCAAMEPRSWNTIEFYQWNLWGELFSSYMVWKNLNLSLKEDGV